ncbi:MAG: NADH-quinone oxidoreductase subunit NuoB [Dissulfurispiraceae bacterium]|jgi:Ni,Fe-hydrogenase III small subunit|nr:NADH-quinone oxidoreductase subunit NuoB [Dissulfurispiraceae bacterium]
MLKQILKNLCSRRNAVNISAEAVSAEQELLRSLEGLRDDIESIYGRSLRIRQVDAGSCNACEWECTALSNPVYDIQRFGIDFVASPRHADMLLVTGPVSRQMELALIKTYEAVPDPKFVVACGDCAFNGGVYSGSYAVTGGVSRVLDVDLVIPGCPPSPIKIITSLLAFLKQRS